MTRKNLSYLEFVKSVHDAGVDVSTASLFTIQELRDCYAAQLEPDILENDFWRYWNIPPWRSMQIVEYGYVRSGISEAERACWKHGW